MEEPTFWDNQDKARQVIAQLKPLNGLINPFLDMQKELGDMEALAELAGEDFSLEAELERELGKMERELGEYELRAMFNRPEDVSNAFVHIQAGTGGTEACDWASMMMRMYI